MVSTIIPVTPMYGWGWFVGPNSIAVPAAFELNLRYEGKEAVGPIVTPLHPWHMKVVRLSARHTQWDDDVNVVVEGVGTDDANGFGHVDPLDVTL